MCGIAGIAVTGGKRISSENTEAVRLAMRTMKLRGPDGEGVVSGKDWVLGHVRLAILDPASGAQPWVHEETGTSLTYNGEIYNFHELRELLKRKGHIFKTNCDTEVVLASYLEWGEMCVERFNGFFAFAIADKSKNKLFCVRDRVGIKPFYYHYDNECFSFCSTVPGLLKVSGIRQEMEIDAVSHYLTTSRIVFGEKTLLRGVNTLRPGHLISLDMSSGKMIKKQYWKRPVLTEKEKSEKCPDFDSACEQVHLLLEDSVRKRLISDVPLGAFLSGGLDSAIIALAAEKFTQKEIPFFCAGTDDEASNEYHYARLAAKNAGGNLQELKILADDFSKNWNFLIGEKGLPLCTPNEVSIYSLACELRKLCKVTLTGEGADEIFGGYVQPHFSAFDFDRCAHTPEDADNKSDFALSMIMLYGRSFFINDTDHYTATCSWMPFAEKSAFFKPEIWKAMDEDNAVFSFYEDFFDELEGCSSFDKRLHLYAEFNLEGLLGRIDNCTMSASVEARVPFNDHRLVEYAFSMPDSYKMYWRDKASEDIGRNLTASEIDRRNLLETKRLPRNAFRKELPHEIVDRKKMSFPVPFQKWFYGPLFDEVRELCMDSSLSKELFDQNTLSGLLQNKSRNLWLIANLCKWQEVLDQ